MNENIEHMEMRTRLADLLAALWQCPQSEYLARANAVIAAASGAVMPSLTDEQILTRAADHHLPVRFPHETVAFGRALLALATPVAGWVSVEDERKPEHEQVVAVIFPAWGDYERGRMVAQATYFHGEFINDDGDQTWPPSHWMPLPPAPVATPTMQNQQEQK